MVQPKKPPVSLRIPDAVKDRVNKYAAAKGIPRNAAYVELIERGLKAAAPGLPSPEVQAAIRAEAIRRQAPKPEPFKTRLKGEWKAP